MGEDTGSSLGDWGIEGKEGEGDGDGDGGEAWTIGIEIGGSGVDDFGIICTGVGDLTGSVSIALSEIEGFS